MNAHRIVILLLWMTFSLHALATSTSAFYNDEVINNQFVHESSINRS